MLKKWFFISLCVLAAALLIIALMSSCGGSNTSDSERKGADGGGGSAGLNFNTFVSSDNPCTNSKKLIECYLYPQSVSQKQAHYFMFTCKENANIVEPLHVCRLHIRGVMFALSSSLRSMINLDKTGGSDLPPLRMRLWLVEDINDPQWSEDHSLVLTPQLFESSDEKGSDEMVWLTYFPLAQSDFKAINSFLKSAGGQADTSGILITYHEDLHALTADAQGYKETSHRALAKRQLLASFLVAARDLGVRETNAPSSTTLDSDAIEGLKKWEELLPKKPEQALLEQFRAFHNDFCVITHNFMTNFGLSLNCEASLTTNLTETFPSSKPQQGGDGTKKPEGDSDAEETEEEENREDPSCRCPEDLDSVGRRCGERSVYSKAKTESDKPNCSVTT